MDKVRSLSLVALIVLVPYIFAYPYFALDFQFRMAFLDSGLWAGHRWVEPGTQIATITKVVYFFIWCVPTALGVGALLTAIMIAICFRSGLIFDEKVALLIMRLGWFTAGSAAFTIAAGCVTPMIISWHNANEVLGLRFWVSVPNAGLVLCGLAFLLMGAVLREGIALAKENEAFV